MGSPEASSTVTVAVKVTEPAVFDSTATLGLSEIVELTFEGCPISSSRFVSKFWLPTVTTPATLWGAVTPDSEGTVKVHAPAEPEPGSEPVPSVVHEGSVIGVPARVRLTGWFSVPGVVRSWMSSVLDCPT